VISAAWFSSQITIFQVLEALGVGDGGPEETRQIACPVHQDRRPSARVYGGDENRLYCFTCGRGWDVVGLVMAVQHLTYPAAADWLMETFNLGRPSDLPGQIRQALLSTATSIQPLFSMTEQALRESRLTMGCDRYTRASMALDVVQELYLTKAIDRKTAQQDLTRILRFVKR